MRTIYQRLKAFLPGNSLTVQALDLLPAYSAYKNTYSLLRQSRWWSQEKLAAYQAEALSRLLDHAYENVPYYRRVFNDRGLVPEDIQTPD
ncbi:MAG: phenylacetate--CoA ligase family protein, partial [Candidatus Methanoculleus thermohydrogenotrophicum]